MLGSGALQHPALQTCICVCADVCADVCAEMHGNMGACTCVDVHATCG